MSTEKNDVIPFYEGQIGSWQLKIQRESLKTSELVKRFDRLAKKWHQLLQRLGYHAAYEDMWRYFLQSEHLPLWQDKSPAVLDCGAGTGSFSAAFAKAWEGPLTLSGIDTSPEMLLEAEALYAGQGIEADLECGDIRFLPYQNNAFDLVMTAHVLEHLTDPRIALQEMCRVLKPGGFLVIGATRDSLLGRYIHFKWRTHLFTPSQLSQLVHSVGLNVLSAELPLRGLFSNTSLLCVSEKPT